jgi:hypothetical protein
MANRLRGWSDVEINYTQEMDAGFRAHNCPDRSAVIVCTPPETCGTTPWWMVAGGLGVCVLVLGLALSKRERA